MAKNFGIKGMTEEELRLYRLQQDKAKQMSDEEYGKVYQQNMYKAYPESAPRGLLDEFVYRNMATSNLWGARDMQMGNAGDWALEHIKKQEAQQAAQAMAAKYNAQNNYGEESADFDANWGYKMGYMGDGNMMPGGPTSTTFVPDESKGIINKTISAFDEFKNYFKDFDSPSKGVCTLPSGLQTQQLDRAACDAAGGTFNSPQMISDANAQSEKWYNKNYMSRTGFGVPIGAMKTGIQQLNHMRDAINNAQVNDNKMQKAGFNWTPDKIAWIEKYGIDNLPGQLRDDTGGDTKETAVGRDTVGKFFSSQEGLLSSSQLEDRYPKRYTDNAEANQSIWDRGVNIAEGRTDDVVALNFLEEQARLQAEKDKQALALQQGTDLRIDRRMGADSRAAEDTRLAQERAQQEASIWADKAIDAEEQRIAGDWANQQIDKQERMAAIQAGIDADAGRTTEENYELYSGIDRGEMTPDSLLDGVTEAMESNEEWAEEKAETIKGWVDNIGSTLHSWGSIIVDKVLDVVEGDGESLTEDEVEVIIKAKDELVPAASAEAVVEVKQDGLLATNETATSLLDVPAATVSDTNIFTTTAASTEGFTMDRLKNPLSAENKKWWLEQRPGDIPGNNRAVEFFNTLAYIGTPLKYRPSQTPSESLQDRRIKHMNNQLDYAASQTSTAPSFSALRAAVPSHQVIEDTIRGQVEAGADKGLLFGLIGGDDSDDIDNMIAEKATIIREKMLQMTLANNVIPSIQEAIDALSPPTTTAPPPPPPGEDGAIAAGVKWFTGLF